MKSYKKLSEFIVQIEKDKTLRREFLEKYHKSKREVVKFFKKNGHSYSLKEIDGVLFYSAINRDFPKEKS